MSIIVKGGGGSTAKELVNSTGTKLADLEKKGSGKVSVAGGLGNTPPEKVLQGSIYSDESGVRRTGTMEDITPDLNAQSDLIKEIRAMIVGRATEANATPEDILKGKKAYVGEKLVTGVLEPFDLKTIFGYTKIAVDKFTVSSETELRSKDLSHSLGVSPKFAMLCAQGTPSYSGVKVALTITETGSFNNNQFTDIYKEDNDYANFSPIGGNNKPVLTSSIVNFKNGHALSAGIPYTLITMA